MWNPSLYLRHGSSRLRPALDLLYQTCGMLKNSSESVCNVLDLGCGPGNITPYLCAAFPNAHIHGVDSSKSMIDTANSISLSLDQTKRVSFEVNTIEKLCCQTDHQYDVVYSNASLHWTEKHRAIFTAIVNNLLKPGGILAVQMPDTRTQQSHLLMERAALRTGLLPKTSHVRIPRTEESPQFYYEMLFPICGELDLWSTEYVQQLSSSNSTQHPVLEYTRSTGLMPILEALGGEHSDDCKRYLAEYERLLAEEYPVIESSNTVIFPFKRFFLLARKN